MRRYLISTPEGTSDKLFSECAIRGTARPVIALFEAFGYSEVVTPAIEYYDVFCDSDNILPQESMLKLIDKTGRILVLRPDMTAPIARISATKLSNIPEPYRFYYLQNIFRSGTIGNRINSEVFQCGIELVGASGLYADCEVIALAIKALSKYKENNFRIEIGHVGFYKALSAAIGFSDKDLEKMRKLVEDKNFAALNDMLKNCENKKAAGAIKKLPQLFGGAQVLDEALALTNDPEAVSAINYLREIYSELSKAGLSDSVMIDLGLVNQIHYYTGFVIRGYIEGAGQAVLSGGRYDSLIGGFGRDLAAVGFAIDIDAVSECIKRDEIDPPGYMVYYENGYLKDAISFVERCKTVCELSAEDSFEKAAAVAKSKGIGRIVKIGGHGIKEQGVI